MQSGRGRHAAVLLFLGPQHLVLPLVGGVELGVEEDQFPLEFLALSYEVGEFLLVLLALGAEEDVGLDEVVPLPLQFLLPLEHLVLDLFLVGGALQLVEFLLRLDQLSLVLLDEGLLLVMEMLVQLGVQFLDGLVEGGLGLLDGVDRLFVFVLVFVLGGRGLAGGVLAESVSLH